MKIENFKNILILPPKNLQNNNLSKILVLFYTLKKIGKNVNIFLKEIPENFQFLQSVISPPLKKFIISINASNKEIAEIHYEKNEDKLNLHLVTKEGEIDKNDISFQKQIEYPDLIIVFGEKNLEEAGFYFEKNPGFLLKAPIFVTTLEQTDEIYKNLASNPGLFLPEEESISRLNAFQAKILTKIFDKLDYHKEKQLSVISLEHKDFQGAGFSFKDLKFAILELINFWQIPCFLLLWENQAFGSPKNALFYSPEKKSIKKILENFKGKSKGKGVMFLITENSLERAKEKVLKIIW